MQPNIQIHPLEHEYIQEIFAVSFDRNSGNFLPRMHSQVSHLANILSSSWRMNAQASNPKFSRLILSDVIVEKVSQFSNLREKGMYFIQSFERIVSLEEKTKKEGTHSEVAQVFETCREELFKFYQKNFVLELQQALQNHSTSEHSSFLSVVERMPQNLLFAFMNWCNESQREYILTSSFALLAAEMRQKTRSKDLTVGEHVPCLKKLHNLCQNPQVKSFLVKWLNRELSRVGQMTGREMENNSILSAFLGLTTILSTTDKNAFNYFENNSDLMNRTTLNPLKTQLRGRIKESIDCLHSVLKNLCKVPDGKEPTIAWISAFLHLNDARVNLNKKDPLYLEMSLMFSSEGFLLSFLGVLLQFCKPFLDPQASKLSSIQSNYFLVTKRFDFSKHLKLADSPSTPSQISSTSINFISEIFFMTYYGLHLSLIPSFSHYEDLWEMYSNVKKSIENLKKTYGPNWEATENGAKLKNNLSKITSFLESYDTQLLDPILLEDSARFVQLAIKWLISLVDYGKEPSLEVFHLFSSFPEFLFRVIADTLIYIMRWKYDVLSHIPNLIRDSINFVVVFLNTPKLAKNPIIRAKLANVLTQIVYNKNEHSKRRKISLWDQDYGELAFALQENQFAQKNLAPGLMSIYVDVDIVEGLDVDKEKFDKYNIRRNLGVLLNDMWDIQTFRQSFKRQAKTETFSRFVGTAINDAIHLLEDAIGRLVDIRQLQLAKQDEKEWNAEDPEIKKEREQFLEIQENSARGFMTLANAILDLIGKLVMEEELLNAFLEDKMLLRTEAMLNHFFDALVGPKCNNLKVENPAKYNFSPRELVRKIVTITAQMISKESFIQAMAENPDYSPDIMARTLSLLQSKINVPIKVFEAFKYGIGKVNETIEKKKGSKMEIEKEMDSMEISEEELDEEELEKKYKEELCDELFDTTEMLGDDETYQHYYASNIQSSEATSSKITRLTKECQQLANDLPLSINSSIFVRADDERIDVMKAIIIGPVSTPYALGCFQFDVYFPPSYPLDPPLLNLQTTGNGTVRFNPNLYNCGKVCLSLLGTWHGDNQSSKWNPSTSSLYQVLLSIQALILIDKPYFNEPAYEAQRGTKEGEQRSREYNENIRLNTIRFAMTNMLKNPTPGFEQVIEKHFKVQKERVIKQVETWMKEAQTYKSKFVKAVEELKLELAKL